MLIIKRLSLLKRDLLGDQISVPSVKEIRDDQVIIGIARYNKWIYIEKLKDLDEETEKYFQKIIMNHKKDMQGFTTT